MAVLIKLSNLTDGNNKMSKILSYTLYKPRALINLNIFEAEKYEAAVVVQQLVGNLIYYSNKGRYEPRLAQSWERVAPNIWVFELKSELKCENGEAITPVSFKKSIERAIFIFSKKGDIPVLGYLVGIKEFINNNQNNTNLEQLTSLAGIRVNGNSLSFEFDRPIKSGLLQILSFSPFGYISIENFNDRGEWKNDLVFISSGPFAVKSIQVGKQYELVRNPYWREFASNAPEIVRINHVVPDKRVGVPVIIDAFTQTYENSNFRKFQLVPEYINSVLLGNLSEGYFKSLEVRAIFKEHFERKRDRLLPYSFGTNTRSSSFYPNQNSEPGPNLKVLGKIKPTLKPLIIEGKIPLEGTPRSYAWKILKEVLEENNMPFEFSNTEGKFEDMINKDYDIRIRGSSIGGGVEAWGLFVAFCSPFGINFPDPSGRVCEMIQKYDRDEIDDKILTENFLDAVESDSAILAVSHYGIQMFLSDEIDLESISPMMSIMRFDQLDLRNAD